MSPRPVAWGLVAALAAAAMGLWLYNQGEWVEHEVDLGYRGEAARNPYLAAGRLLRRMGIPTRELPRHLWIDGPPPDLDVLVITTERYALTGRWLDRLLDWVTRGGHLVVAAASRPGEEEDDPLFEALGLISHYYDEIGDPRAASIEIDGVELSAEFRSRTRLTAEDAFESLGEDDYGALAMVAGLGQGRVTALAGFEPFTNSRVGDHDHAELLVRLLAPGDTAPTVGLSLEEDMPGLLDWLWQRIPQALISLALLSALFLWWRGHRFGRLADLPPPARRSLLEHIEAGGWFLWRQGHGGRLLQAVRATLVDRAAGRVGGLTRRPFAEQVRMIARMSGLPNPRVAAAMELPDKPSDQDFIHHAAELEAIRKRL